MIDQPYLPESRFKRLIFRCLYRHPTVNETPKKYAAALADFKRTTYIAPIFATRVGIGYKATHERDLAQMG